jgi:hypothetical protein
MELLDMQWVLQRLMGMCGSAGWPSLELEDDDIDDYFNYNYTDCIPSHTDDNACTSYKTVHKWISSPLPPHGPGLDIPSGTTYTRSRIQTPTTGLSMIECP